jgi:hypothetical protein
MYNVGFGDCFLLQFRYGQRCRNILIDFGSSAAPPGAAPGYMKRVAQDIAARCTQSGSSPKLHAIVATHRHSDHISGFARGRDGPGDIIAALEPEVIVQPWTEDPAAEPDAKAPVVSTRAAVQGYLATLRDLQSLAGFIHVQASDGRLQASPRILAEIQFLGLENLKNAAAVQSLAVMGRRGRAFYLHCGSKSGLEHVLPGVRTHVLGPPTIEQTATIHKRRSIDPDEFWHFADWQRTWRLSALANQLVTPGGFRLFRRSQSYSIGKAPLDVSWFAETLRQLHAEDILGLVRALDAALNNTSVILLFEVGSHYLLFPGDAQIESWAYAMQSPKNRLLLSRVDLYKVGHHGSLNATPKTFWDLLKLKGGTLSGHRITTLLSTMPGKHGHVEDRTEVPRQTLVDVLKRETQLISSDAIAPVRLSTSVELTIEN